MPMSKKTLIIISSLLVLCLVLVSLVGVWGSRKKSGDIVPGSDAIETMESIEDFDSIIEDIEMEVSALEELAVPGDIYDVLGEIRAVLRPVTATPSSMTINLGFDVDALVVVNGYEVTDSLDSLDLQDKLAAIEQRFDMWGYMGDEYFSSDESVIKIASYQSSSIQCVMEYSDDIARGVGILKVGCVEKPAL
jgi:hypothetical protein